jgi:hypothetical protein
LNDSRPLSRPVDEHAVRISMDSGLLPCLYLPVAARDMIAIDAYVGTIMDASGRQSENALIVDAYQPDQLDNSLAIWDAPRAEVLHARTQFWVHVDFRGYRRAYKEAFPQFHLSGLVLDHVMNRRVARIKGFTYVRLLPISRGANSSHGSLSEDWAVKYHSSHTMLEINRSSKASVQYADRSDIAKMLDLQGGGSFMDIVNEAQQLVDLPNEAGERRLSATRASR